MAGALSTHSRLYSSGHRSDRIYQAALCAMDWLTFLCTTVHIPGSRLRPVTKQKGLVIPLEKKGARLGYVH